MNFPQITLKVVVGLHFILTVWASLSASFLPPAYLYMNGFILAFGFWGIVSRDNTEPVQMFLILNLFSIVQDVIFLGIYAPYGEDLLHGVMLNTYRFSLGMSIVNLIIKPVTCFLLFRIYQERGGSQSDFLPQVGNISTPWKSGSPSHAPVNPYQNIDQSVPPNTVDSPITTEKGSYQ